MVFSDFFAVVFAVVVSRIILWFLIPSLRNRLVDQPNERSCHHQPTPRGGGVVFVAVSSVASFLALLLSSGAFLAAPGLLAAPLIALPLALVGLLDDRYKLPATWRYGFQVITALLVILVSPLVGPSVSLLPVIVLLLVGVTAVINFTNFMDGLDGLVAGSMAVLICTAGIQMSAPLPIWILVGSIIGFLSLNWSPASVFMGDVGSTFLGAVFSVIVLQASTWPESLGLLLVASPLLGDACLCVPRRLMDGQRVFQAHRLHLFQRLYQAGWSHSRVSILYIVATAILAIALLLGGLPWVTTLAAIELLLGIWLDQQVAVPFSVASRS